MTIPPAAYVWFSVPTIIYILILSIAMGFITFNITKKKKINSGGVIDKFVESIENLIKNKLHILNN